MKRFALVVVVGLAGLAGCLKEPSPTAPPAVAPEAPHAHAHAHEGVPNAAPAAPAPAAPAAPPAPGTTVQRLGAPITETQTVSLADLRSNPARFAGRTIRTEGVVAAVCQAAGCWMQLADEAGREGEEQGEVVGAHQKFAPIPIWMIRGLAVAVERAEPT